MQEGSPPRTWSGNPEECVGRSWLGGKQGGVGTPAEGTAWGLAGSRELVRPAGSLPLCREDGVCAGSRPISAENSAFLVTGQCLCDLWWAERSDWGL